MPCPWTLVPPSTLTECRSRRAKINLRFSSSFALLAIFARDFAFFLGVRSSCPDRKKKPLAKDAKIAKRFLLPCRSCTTERGLPRPRGHGRRGPYEEGPLWRRGASLAIGRCWSRRPKVGFPAARSWQAALRWVGDDERLERQLLESTRHRDLLRRNVGRYCRSRHGTPCPYGKMRDVLGNRRR